MLHSISKTTVGTAEGSKGMRSKTDKIDDPLTYGESRNVMPTLPSESKKKYFKDYENFIIK
jgi:hypothetical protein